MLTAVSQATVVSSAPREHLARPREQHAMKRPQGYTCNIKALGPRQHAGRKRSHLSWSPVALVCLRGGACKIAIGVAAPDMHLTGQRRRRRR